jgi:UV DNA damage endonuclease
MQWPRGQTNGILIAMRLGFVAKSLVHPELKSHDARRWQNSPHLSVSLAYLRDMLLYLRRARIHMYRLISELAPYVTHPDLPQFHGQIEACAAELAAIGRMARADGLRLSFHAGQHVVLNSPDSALVGHSAADVLSQSTILDAMGLDAEAVVITHLGGLYGDREISRARFVEAYTALPPSAQRRLALENDDTRFSVADTLWVHERTGIRLVFDTLHHRINNPTGLPIREALAACLATWPPDVRPKIHFSSPRTELNIDPAGSGSGHGAPRPAIPRIRPPQWRNHADYVNPFEFVDFLHLAEGLREFDVMLEVKAKDLALEQLRRDLAWLAPDLAARLDGGRPALAAAQPGDDATDGRASDAGAEAQP